MRKILDEIYNKYFDDNEFISISLRFWRWFRFHMQNYQKEVYANDMFVPLLFLGLCKCKNRASKRIEKRLNNNKETFKEFNPCEMR